MIDLTYLRKVSGDDETFVRTMIDNFLEYAPQYVKEMQSALGLQEWDLLAKTAHKLKPGAVYMGAESLHKQLLAIEAYIKDEEIKPEDLSLKIKQVSQTCQETCNALSNR